MERILRYAFIAILLLVAIIVILKLISMIGAS